MLLQAVARVWLVDIRIRKEQEAEVKRMQELIFRIKGSNKSQTNKLSLKDVIANAKIKGTDKTHNANNNNTNKLVNNNNNNNPVTNNTTITTIETTTIPTTTTTTMTTPTRTPLSSNKEFSTITPTTTGDVDIYADIHKLMAGITPNNNNNNINNNDDNNYNNNNDNNNNDNNNNDNCSSSSTIGIINDITVSSSLKFCSNDFVVYLNVAGLSNENLKKVKIVITNQPTNQFSELNVNDLEEKTKLKNSDFNFGVASQPNEPRSVFKSFSVQSKVK
eukprot:Pgem_evm1s4964